MRLRRRGGRFLEQGRESGNYMASCSESEEELRAMVGRSVEMCRRRELKVNVGKRKLLLINGEKGLECEVHVGGE